MGCLWHDVEMGNHEMRQKFCVAGGSLELSRLMPLKAAL